MNPIVLFVKVNLFIFLIGIFGVPIEIVGSAMFEAVDIFDKERKRNFKGDSFCEH